MLSALNDELQQRKDFTMASEGLPIEEAPEVEVESADSSDKHEHMVNSDSGKSPRGEAFIPPVPKHLQNGESPRSPKRELLSPSGKPGTFMHVQNSESSRSPKHEVISPAGTPATYMLAPSPLPRPVSHPSVSMPPVGANGQYRTVNPGEGLQPMSLPVRLPLTLPEDQNNKMPASLHPSHDNGPVDFSIPSIVAQDGSRFAQLGTCASHESHSENRNVKKRKLLRDWLQDHLNRGTFPGAVWVNRGKSTFKIPWLHRAKPGWREEDAQIFKAWSQYSGTLKSRDSEATLKTRFRCALTKANDIEYMKQYSSTDDENCYRVYRFKSKEEMRRRPAALDNSVKLESMHANGYTHQAPSATAPQEQPTMLPMEQNAIPTFVTAPHFLPQTYTMMLDESGNQYIIQHADHTEDATQSERAIVGPFAVTDHDSSAQQQTENPMDTKSELVTRREEHSSIGAIQSDMEVDISPVTSQEKNSTHQVVENPANTRPEPVTRTAGNQYFTIDLYYEGKRVASRPFKEGITCHICPQNSSSGAEKTALHMPPWDGKKYTGSDPRKVEKFFQHIGDGIDIELDGGNLYATRRCLVRVFYSSFLKYQLSPHLERGQRSLIFSLKEFEESLQTLNQDDRTDSMCSCEVFLGFGMPWIFRDGDEKMTFIAAKVKSSEAEQMKNMKLMEENTHKINSLTISDSLPENSRRMGEENTVLGIK